MLNIGDFYNTITEQRKDSDELKSCMEKVVEQLINRDTNMNKPGMLLGKIQAGKTRAFIGIIALAFDNEYDMAIILTKGTKALARQTYERLKKDFSEFIDYDLVKLFDILHIPERLPGYVLRQKLIMIVKKETNNLERTIRAIVNTYPDLRNKKILIIDDEADFASIGFNKNQKEGLTELRKIASQIDELRKKVKKSDFLQVTATPYSLYLQPEEVEINRGEDIFTFEPIKPAFTELLPIYKEYVGGDYYFKENKDENSIAHFIFEELTIEELNVLRKEDRRTFKIEESLTSNKIKMLRKGIVNFVVGACVRRIQQRSENKREQKYCFVVHTEYGKQAHNWQVQIVEKIKDLLIYCAENNESLLRELVLESFDDISQSISLTGKTIDFEELFKEVLIALIDDYLMIRKINSETEVEQLLDDNGELERTAPLNIFIGGQILDRGVTIKNLIGFYYGRRPGRFQQDTVLQHSRMFGNREEADLAVTRFYTASSIFSVMETINEFDNALREAFEKEAQSGVVFICKDPTNKILPCNPNKISISSTTALTPLKRILPVGFQTDYKSKIKAKIEKIDEILYKLIPSDNEKPVEIQLEVAVSIIDMINETFVYESGYEWDVKGFKACMEFVSKNTSNSSKQGKVIGLLRDNRNLSRMRSRGTFQDTPDTGSGETVLDIARRNAIDIPAVIFIRQNGSSERGWRDSPFWWPVLVAPQRMKPVIFAKELIDVG